MSDLRVRDLSKEKEVKKLKWKNYFSFKKLKWKFIWDIIIQPFKSLWSFICALYSDAWDNKKKIFIISTIVFVIYTLFVGIQSLINGTSFKHFAIDVGKAILVYFIFKIVFLGVHQLVGYLLILKREMELTDVFINTKMPKIAKVSGRTGAGKDTFARAVGTSKVRYLKKKLNDKMKRISQELIFVNFSNLNQLIENDVKSHDHHYDSKYATFDTEVLAKILAKDFLANKSLIKRKYQDRFNAREMSEDYAEFKKEPRFYKSKYVIDELIDSNHSIELIVDYTISYFRLNIDKNFIISNQPMIEDKKKELMAKEFSLDYFKLIHTTKKKDTVNGVEVSKEKVIFALTDDIVIIESEVDSFYNNLDKSINYELLAQGVRDAFAYNRHLFGEDFSYYQVGQNAGRCASLIRELTHSFIYIISKKTIDGGRIRNFFLKIMSSPFDFILAFNQLIYDYKIKKLKLKKELNVKKYNLQYQATHNIKWNIKARKLEKKSYPERKGITLLAEKISAWCSNKIAKFKNDGWIEMKLSFSNSAQGTASNVMSLKEIVKKDLTLDNAVVQVCFKRTDTHGLYDTHYLSALKKGLIENSDINFYGAKVWSKDMKLTKEDSIYANYKALDKFFGTTKEERQAHSFETTIEDPTLRGRKK